MQSTQTPCTLLLRLQTFMPVHVIKHYVLNVKNYTLQILALFLRSELARNTFSRKYTIHLIVLKNIGHHNPSPYKSLVFQTMILNTHHFPFQLQQYYDSEMISISNQYKLHMVVNMKVIAAHAILHAIWAIFHLWIWIQLHRYILLHCSNLTLLDRVKIVYIFVRYSQEYQQPFHVFHQSFSFLSRGLFGKMTRPYHVLLV